VSFDPRASLSSSASSLVVQLHHAHARRAELAASADCYRVHDAGELELPGITVERYGDFAVVHDYVDLDGKRAQEVARAVCELGAKGVYRKRRMRGDPRKDVTRQQLEVPIAGESAPTEFTVSEHGRRFAVRLADGPATGLFIDQRDNRDRVQALSRGKNVLNLFCYTGSFSIAAGLGGANKVTSIDNTRAALRRVDRNLHLNGIAGPGHRLLRADAVEWLGRAVRRGERFDLVVLDPPTFSSGTTRTFRAREQYESMLGDCLRLLSPGGRLLAVSNDRGTSREVFDRTLRFAVERVGRELLSLEAPPLPVDCPLGNDPEAATKSRLVSVG
jgi:23S rRNA (cytosine1962-C5)-methyltransferase